MPNAEVPLAPNSLNPPPREAAPNELVCPNAGAEAIAGFHEVPPKAVVEPNVGAGVEVEAKVGIGVKVLPNAGAGVEDGCGIAGAGSADGKKAGLDSIETMPGYGASASVKIT